MAERSPVLALGLGAAMVLGVGGLFLATHYRALLNGGAPALSENQALSGRLNLPTIEEMCAAQGATAETLAQCKFDESAAAEFVVAWMGLNGFLLNGGIDLAQIELVASLGPDPGSPLGEPDPVLTDGQSDDSLNGALPDDPGLSIFDTGENADPLTGLAEAEGFDSKAQVAMHCLSESSDWIALHGCIYRYDPSSRFSGQ